ncbi:synapse-associated protein 1-like isoform X2 [Paramacrobiotus metropolitanus]|uniref:synapse-associated protein 1-like isoform X2 n=1 Tax=Paramacrobiotus metropolitanus TaxID=2943436 RepID=UPI00244606F6|nr:synapse-associated protein 1-like isoform X2 [Paramacrobiotus metropolitanus]
MEVSPLLQTDTASDSTRKRTEESEEAQHLPENVESHPEKPLKVQKTAGLFGVFSNLAAGITTASQSVLEQAKEASKAVQKTLEDKTIIGGFNRMQNEFIQERMARDKGPGVAPWSGCNNEEEVKKQVLALSADRRNFTRDPPSGANFEFDLESAMPIAVILLQDDPELNKKRFELVPKVVSEHDFWRNYYYRISLIKQSSMLTVDTSDMEGTNTPRGDIDRDDISVASNLDLMDGSVVGDSDTHTAEHVVVPSCPPSADKPGKSATSETGKAAEEGWEQELQQTLDSYEVVGGETDIADTELDQALSNTVDDQRTV